MKVGVLGGLGPKATADFMITSSYMDREYEHKVMNFSKNVQDRANTL